MEDRRPPEETSDRGEEAAETGLAIQTGPDWKSSHASDYGRVYGPRTALESGGMSGSPGRENGDQVHEQVQGEGGGRIVAPGGKGGVGDGQGSEAVEVHQHEGDKVHDQVQGGGGRRDVAPGGDGGVICVIM